MRSSNSKIQEKSEAVNSETPLENGLPPKEKLPTIQIDTVPSAPSSPVDLSPLEESNEVDEPLDTSEIQFDLETAEQEDDSSHESLKELLKTFVEDILSQAMVLAEKKLQFAGLPDEDEEDVDQSEPVQSSSRLAKEPEKEIDNSEIRAAAEKVVEEVITKASETAAEILENGIADLSFPGLPSIQIDTVKSAPPSPELEEEIPRPQKKWTFTMDDDESESEKNDSQHPERKLSLITFDEAPEEVKDAATSLVKEIVGKAVAMAEEKSTPAVPFNFEDVDLMKNSGPWYIRAREALLRLLRTACFCTPRRSDS